VYCRDEYNSKVIHEIYFGYSGYWELELSSKLRVGDRTSHDRGLVIDAFGLQISGTSRVLLTRSTVLT